MLANIGKLAGGAAFSQALLVLAAPFLTRLFTPAQYGMLAVYLSMLGILLPVSMLRYDIALLLPREKEEAYGLFALSCAALLFGSVLVALPVLVWPARIAMMAGVPDLAAYLWLLPLGLGTGAFVQLLTAWATRERAFPAIARARIHQSVAQIGIQMVLGFAAAGGVGLLLGNMAGQLAGMKKLSAGFQRRELRGAIHGAKLSALAKRYRSYPVVSAPAALLNSVALQIPTLAMASIFDAEFGGYWGFATRLVSTPLVIVGSAVSQVFNEEFARKVATDRGAARSAYRQTVRTLAAFGTVPCFVLMLWAPWLFALVFGPNWRGAGNMAAALAPMLLAQLVSAPASMALTLMGGQRLQFIWDIARLLAMAALFGFARRISTDPIVIVRIYALVMSVFYVLHVLLTFRRLVREEA
jgi:O-antigen/teichoic acid export membrane protein